jgi:hypothetical protein
LPRLGLPAGPPEQLPERHPALLAGRIHGHGRAVLRFGLLEPPGAFGEAPGEQPREIRDARIVRTRRNVQRLCGLSIGILEQPDTPSIAAARKSGQVQPLPSATAALTARST